MFLKKYIYISCKHTYTPKNSCTHDHCPKKIHSHSVSRKKLFAPLPTMVTRRKKYHAYATESRGKKFFFLFFSVFFFCRCFYWKCIGRLRLHQSRCRNVFGRDEIRRTYARVSQKGSSRATNEAWRYSTECGFDHVRLYFSC